jgi:uncharacterized membrane protein YphA (DoxX/SURF4 family)
MNERMVVGLTPWLPWPLSRWPWWTEPVRAERLAALRIGLALVLLVDVLVQYLPHYADFFGAGSLGSAEVFAGRNTGHWHWSLLRGIEDSRWFVLILLIWAAAAVLLLVGWQPRLAALVAWVLSISFLNLNYGLHNSGDRIRSIVLFYLMLTPCGAAWSLHSFLRPKVSGVRSQESAVRSQESSALTPDSCFLIPTFISPWSLRLLFVQMALIYLFNGFYKIVGPDWRSGDALHSILGNVQWARWSFAELSAPYPVTKVLTWLVLAWELGFPILVIMKPLRTPTLWFGVALHIGLAVSLELGLFSFYMLCLYLPLVPWERWKKHERSNPPRALT